MIMGSIAFIYPDADAARDDQEVGGTGFLISLPFGGNPAPEVDHLYVATARHLLSTGPAGEPWSSPVIAFSTSTGLETYTTAAVDWEPHPDGDDLAVASINGFRGTGTITALAASHFVTQKEVRDLDIGIGDEVFYMGRFQPPEGNSIPTVRFGNISHMPLKIWHEGFKCWVDSFLIEGRSRGGYSGSPVVLRLSWGRHHGKVWPDVLSPQTPASLEAVALMNDANFDRVLGVNWGHTTEVQTARMGRGVPVDLDVNEGIMCVVPGWRILDILMSRRFTEQREKDEAEDRDGGAKGKHRVVLDSLPESPEPFTR
jgi:hypothetical protein